MHGLEHIPGGAELCQWYGGVPSFHDAEIIDLNLDRSGTSRLRLRAWKMTDQVDQRGYFVPTKQMIATFLLEDIVDLELSGFNRQNVIHGLSVKPVVDAYELVLDHCWGLSGRLVARQIRVEFAPQPPDMPIQAP